MLCCVSLATMKGEVAIVAVEHINNEYRVVSICKHLYLSLKANIFNRAIVVHIVSSTTSFITSIRFRLRHSK